MEEHAKSIEEGVYGQVGRELGKRGEACA